MKHLHNFMGIKIDYRRYDFFLLQELKINKMYVCLMMFLLLNAASLCGVNIAYILHENTILNIVVVVWNLITSIIMITIVIDYGQKLRKENDEIAA